MKKNMNRDRDIGDDTDNNDAELSNDDDDEETLKKLIIRYNSQN